MNSSNTDPRIERLRRRQGPYRKFLEALGPLSERPSGTEELVDDIHALVAEKRPSLTRLQVIKCLKAMDDEGFGTFVTGRRGGKSRFYWKLPRQSRQTTTAVDYAPMPSTPRSSSGGPFMGFLTTSSAQVPETSFRHGNGDDSKVHKINCLLRSDFPVAFSLPGDLTTAEANRICQIIMALPAGAQE